MSENQARIVIGRNIIVERKDSESSIEVENPAIITRHHGDGVINCRVFEDGHHIPWLTSIPKKHALRPGQVQPLNWWFWPPRSPAARAEGEAERRDAEQPSAATAAKDTSESSAPGFTPAAHTIPHQGIGPGQQGIGGQGPTPSRSGPPRERLDNAGRRVPVEPERQPPGNVTQPVAGPAVTPTGQTPAPDFGPKAEPFAEEGDQPKATPAPGEPGYQQPTPKPTNPDGSRYDPAKEEAKPADEKTGERLDRSGPSLPSTGYQK